MNTKKMTVPDIGGLLGQIAAKRPDMPKTAIQHVQPIEEGKQESGKEEKNLRGKTLESERVIEVSKIGRKTKKVPEVEYVKISPKIAKPLKKRVDIAIKSELITDAEGTIITTLDECVAYALEQILNKRV